jgi:two-component system sensor histidine kinase/response regulator
MNDQPTGELRGNILIVDDTSHIRTLLSHMLVSQGHEVQAVTGGPQALEAARATPFDLILLDIMMPDMDGYEVCQQLKADPQTCDIPVIFISALERVEDKVKAFGSGGVDYIPKPFQMKEVVARVTTHLSLRALQQRLAAQLEELQARNEELDALARTMARDLKTPLTSIIGFADMLDDIGPMMAQKDLRNSLRAIASNARKMDGIIDELLLLAGLRQVGHTDLGPLDMGAVVDGALRRLADVIEEHQADIVRPDTWPTALGYGPWVEEVWVKFIGDAIAHGAKPPQIELGATADEEGDVRFWVRDNGPSMTIERQDGVGMVVVRRIMEKLGRDVSLESAGDEGNILSFTLRAA